MHAQRCCCKQLISLRVEQQYTWNEIISLLQRNRVARVVIAHRQGRAKLVGSMTQTTAYTDIAGPGARPARHLLLCSVMKRAAEGDDDPLTAVEKASEQQAHEEAKRARKLQFEQLYAAALPSANMYERSYMHRDTVTHTAASKAHFIITASMDGHVKFWKKVPIFLHLGERSIIYTGAE